MPALSHELLTPNVEAGCFHEDRGRLGYVSVREPRSDEHQLQPIDAREAARMATAWVDEHFTIAAECRVEIDSVLLSRAMYPDGTNLGDYDAQVSVRQTFRSVPTPCHAVLFVQRGRVVSGWSTLGRLMPIAGSEQRVTTATEVTGRLQQELRRAGEAEAEIGLILGPDPPVLGFVWERMAPVDATSGGRRLVPAWDIGGNLLVECFSGRIWRQ